MKTCISCSRTFDRLSDVIEGSACPTMHCKGHVVELDDNIYYTIIELNKKGYTTIDSCSGHTLGNTAPYILFTDNFCEHSFSSLPNGFKSETTLNRTFRLFAEIQQQPAWERQKSLMEASVNLIQWSRHLGNVKEIVVQFPVTKDSNKNRRVARIKKLVKDNLNLKFFHVAEDWGPYDGSSEDPVYIEYTNLIDEHEVENFSAKINSFSDHYNLSCNVIDITCSNW